MPARDGLRWFKSSRSGGNDTCVEVAFRPDGPVCLRDSKSGDVGPVLRFTVDGWHAFLAGVRDGEFDR
ncbi:MAG TPA: DUF397 domain-containing protein [Pseudonocardia sp.]|jgi:hypothetical protein